MANNQDKGTPGTTTPGMGNTAGTGQQGGQGSGGGRPDQQQGGSQSGQKPEDKMNKDADRTHDTGSAGGKPDQSGAQKENTADQDRMGGHTSQGDKTQWDKNR